MAHFRWFSKYSSLNVLESRWQKSLEPTSAFHKNLLLKTSLMSFFSRRTGNFLVLTENPSEPSILLMTKNRIPLKNIWLSRNGWTGSKFSGTNLIVISLHFSNKVRMLSFTSVEFDESNVITFWPSKTKTLSFIFIPKTFDLIAIKPSRCELYFTFYCQFYKSVQ